MLGEDAHPALPPLGLAARLVDHRDEAVRPGIHPADEVFDGGNAGRRILEEPAIALRHALPLRGGQQVRRVPLVQRLEPNVMPLEHDALGGGLGGLHGHVVSVSPS